MFSSYILEIKKKKNDIVPNSEWISPVVKKELKNKKESKRERKEGRKGTRKEKEKIFLKKRGRSLTLAFAGFCDVNILIKVSFQSTKVKPLNMKLKSDAQHHSCEPV